MAEWMVGLVVIEARTVSNKTRISQHETQQCPCSSRPQDILRTSLVSFRPSTSSVVAFACARSRVEKHGDACDDQVNGTSVRLVLLEAHNESGGRVNPS